MNKKIYFAPSTRTVKAGLNATVLAGSDPYQLPTDEGTVDAGTALSKGATWE